MTLSEIINKALDTIIGTFRGLDNEGSSKRATAFGFFLLSFILIGSYAFCYVYVVVNDITTISGVTVRDQFTTVLFTVVGTLSTALGITYFDKKLDTKKEVALNNQNNAE